LTPDQQMTISLYSYTRRGHKGQTLARAGIRDNGTITTDRMHAHHRGQGAIHDDQMASGLDGKAERGRQ
jgi:hypothetical protein